VRYGHERHPLRITVGTTCGGGGPTESLRRCAAGPLRRCAKSASCYGRTSVSMFDHISKRACQACQRPGPQAHWPFHGLRWKRCAHRHHCGYRYDYAHTVPQQRPAIARRGSRLPPQLLRTRLAAAAPRPLPRAPAVRAAGAAGARPRAKPVSRHLRRQPRNGPNVLCSAPELLAAIRMGWGGSNLCQNGWWTMGGSSLCQTGKHTQNMYFHAA
jgi:hypothetical protein